MAVNKVEINGEVKLDLTQDTVTPENLLSGATAHNAAGERIVGAVTAGGGITNFPTIAEVRANWTAVNLTTNSGDKVIHFTSSIILAFIIGTKEELDRGIFFWEVNQNQDLYQDLYFENLCNEDGNIHVFTLFPDRGGIGYDIEVSDVLSGEVLPNTTFQSVIYYTTADNFFSK